MSFQEVNTCIQIKTTFLEVLLSQFWTTLVKRSLLSQIKEYGGNDIYFLLTTCPFQERVVMLVLLKEKKRN